MTELGWVAIPRKIQHEKFYKDSHYVHLFLHLILSMNRKESYVNFIKIEKFQLLTSRKSLSESLKVNSSKIERMLNKLEKYGYIEQQKTNKYRVITVLYEDCRNKFEQQVNNKRTTSEQQVNTNNNINNITDITNIKKNKQKKKKYGKYKHVLLTDQEYKKRIETYETEETLKEAIKYLDEKIEEKGYKYKSHFLTLKSNNWVYKNVFKNKEKEEYPL
jgi:Mn-dependent DtxR family transcriptional regulator